ncbi:MAG: hypothetical protein ABF264_03580 [Flavobacteriales bacterium]|jgi:hypothetical protein
MKIKDLAQYIKPIHLVAVGLILVFNLVYFAPQLDGKIVKAHDAISSTAWTKLPADYTKKTGEPSQWNSSMFSGMPWGLLSNGIEYNYARKLNDVSHSFFSYPAGYMIKAGLLTYLALILLGVSPWLSVILALAFSYNVNYVVLIEAGHANKLEVLAGFPLLISGLILAFRGKSLLGFVIVSLSVSIAFVRNHPQMVYYLFILLFVFALVYFIYSIKNKQPLHFLKSSAVILAAVALGAASNISQIMSSKDFSDDTMRGKPILESNTETANTSSSVSGLNWEYAMGWSFAKEDVFSILIPRAVGGSSKEEIGKAEPGKQTLANALKGDGRFKPKKDGNYIFGIYFGGMGSTGGSAYLGAAVLFLFLFSMFLLNWKNRLAFGFVAITLIALSLGKNFEALNLFLFENLPFFNKFRAPSSIINILPAFLVIAIGIGLNKFLKEENKAKYLKPVLISAGITAGISILYYMYAMNGYDKINEGQPMIVEARKSLLGEDVMRSVFIVALACLAFYLYIKNKIKANFLMIGIAALVLVDLILVGKRYLDADSFVNASTYQSEFNPRPVDQQIFSLEPKGRAYYRVFDQSIPTFNNAKTSYHHNTIGGYHAAKLQRYQDLIDFQIAKGNMQVLNMLNTKYFINQQQQLQPINNQANGVAWFIKELTEVNTPMEEIRGLDTLNTRERAVILSTEFNKENYDQVGDGTGSISLDSYLPNNLVYSATNTSDQFAVFSEIWYGRNDSWRAYIDGVETKIVRVNYALRGLEVPANAKRIEFVLDPPAKYAAVSGFTSGFLLFMLVLLLVLPKKYKEKLNFVPKQIS